MHLDYTLRVVETYQRKLANGDLPLALTNLSPARVRQACINVFDSRYTKRDNKALEDFFGAETNFKKYHQLIGKCDINKFKPVIRFLKNPTIKTREKNIELLAWLIDFQPRPYNKDIKYDQLSEVQFPMDEQPSETEIYTTLETLIGDNQSAPVEAFENEPQTTAPLSANYIRKKKYFIKRIIGLTTAAMIIGFSFFIFRPDQDNINPDLVVYKYQSPSQTDQSQPPLPKMDPDLRRCQGITKKHTQCKRVANASGFCWQHD